MNFQSHKFDYKPRDHTIAAMKKGGPDITFSRIKPAGFEDAHNYAIALYRYMVNEYNFDYDTIICKNGTIFDDDIKEFMESVLLVDPNFNENGFKNGVNRAIRIIKCREKSMTYIGDFVEDDVINQFQEYLNSSKKMGGR